MTELSEMVAIIGIITGSLFGLFRYEINKICKEIISLPIYPTLENNQQLKIIKKINNFYL